MTKHTTDFKYINWNDFMAPKGWESIECFFDAMSDLGLPLAIGADQLIQGGEEEFDLYLMGVNLKHYGEYLFAKGLAFEALSNGGFESVKGSSDYYKSSTIYIDDLIGVVLFETCYCNDVIYVKVFDTIEVAFASQAKTAKERKKANGSIASQILSGLIRHKLDNRV